MEGTAFSPQIADDAPFLLDRRQAAERYGISIRMLEKLYKRYPDFPVIRIGWKVLIHRDKADRWFTEFVGADIDT